MSRDITMFRTPLLEVMAQKAVRARGQRCDQVYNNTFYWTISHGGRSHRSGSTIWHDNTFLGRDPGNHDHTDLPYFRQLGLVSNDLSNWGFADGENGWDKNDPHGVYLSGTAASNTTISGATGTFTTGTTMTAHAYQGMQVRNDHVGIGVLFALGLY